jgi:hypothetical protein
VHLTDTRGSPAFGTEFGFVYDWWLSAVVLDLSESSPVLGDLVVAHPTLLCVDAVLADCEDSRSKSGIMTGKGFHRRDKHC